MVEVKEQFKVGAVQAEPIWMDARGTIDKTIDLMRQGANAGAQLLAFPELWIPGYPGFMLTHDQTKTVPFIKRYRRQSISVDGPEIEMLRDSAKKYEIGVAFGFSERGGNSLYMSQMMIDLDGEVKMSRRKLKPTRFERELFGEGDGSDLQVVETSSGRVGALNCAEHLQSLNKFALADAGEQVHISSWPFSLGNTALVGESMSAINQTYAGENGAFVLMSTLVVTEAAIKAFDISDDHDASKYMGGGFARIFGPDMRLLTTPLPADEEGIVYADIDLSMIEGAKYVLDPTGHYSRPDIFEVTIDRRKKLAVRSIVDAPEGAATGGA